MKTNALAVGAATFAALITVGACANTSTTQGAPSSSVSAPSTSATDAHNQADAMFAQHMIPHHRQAIEMSDTLLAKQGIDPRVLNLAKQIKAAQAPEIEQMQTWLTQWGMPTMPGMDMPGHGGMPSVSATPGGTGAPTRPMMPGMPGMSGMPGMDGMMSEEDMSALEGAQGVAAAKLYLTQMIEHHQGAIAMAQNEIKVGRYPDTIALARSIVTSQQKEIDTMNKILPSL